MGGKELNYIHEAFDTNWVAPLGANVDGFEKDLANFLQSGKYVAALSAGTAALHLSLILLGVKEGDYVICQSMTFSASANPIVYQGAIPVFVDSEPETWNMSPEHLERAIIESIAKNKKPKAIILVELYGMPAKMDEIQAISKKYEIPIVEDAAEALGSTYRDKTCGSFGEYAVLSFNGNKIITTSGGGALVCPSNEAAIKARFLATQARDQAPHYEHTHIGYNYRMSNIVAGIGRGQMTVLKERIEARRANNSYYRNAFKDLPFITFQTEPTKDYFSNYWLTSILVDANLSGGITQENIRLELEKHNIESRPLWKPMHLQPIFKNYPYYGSGVSDKLFEDGLCLPSGSNLATGELVKVEATIKKIFNNRHGGLFFDN